MLHFRHAASIDDIEYIGYLYTMQRDPTWHQLRKGSTALVLLHLIAVRPTYGFELAERLRERTDGVLAAKEGTLYPALHSLEADGLVESYWQDSPSGPRRRYYRITQAGREALTQRRAQWTMLMEAVNAALGA
jgi:PadR family transcriptional regulator PadR